MIEYNESYRATYSPEDDKIRLYTGRVSREDYEFLRKNKFTPTAKQQCDFVAYWSYRTEDIALTMCGSIEDEDQSLEDRAADRAERFGAYRDKRLSESMGYMTDYESRPDAYGYQSESKAAKELRAHNLVGNRAVTQWDKAEYWVSRTEGVIRNALHLSSPSVRLGRIKTIEADIRREEKSLKEYNRGIDNLEKALSLYGDSPDELANYIGTIGTIHYYYNGHYTSIYSLIHYNKIPPQEVIESYLSTHKKIDNNRYLDHLRLRLTYENMMIAAVGGKASEVSMEVGGIVRIKLRNRGYNRFLQDAIITKINKSPVTKQITSIQALYEKELMTGDIEKWGELEISQMMLSDFNIERSTDLEYREPTELSKKYLKLFEDYKKTKKESIAPLFNPDIDTAEFLQSKVNKYYGEKHAIAKMSNIQYSAVAKGAYSPGRVVCFDKFGNIMVSIRMNKKDIACRVRMYNYSIVVLKDKPMKTFNFDREEIKEVVNEPA